MRVDADKPVGADDAAVISLVDEALRVRKQRVQTGRVRISVATDSEERLVRETLHCARAEVERVAIDRELEAGEAAPVAHYEADGTFVLPVLEEVLVIERRLVLREEVRLRVVGAEESVEQTITLRRQRAEIERLPPENQGTLEELGAVPSKDDHLPVRNETTTAVRTKHT